MLRLDSLKHQHLSRRMVGARIPCSLQYGDGQSGLLQEIDERHLRQRASDSAKPVIEGRSL